MFDLFVTAAWKVLVAGLVLGAGLPAVFALGVRFSAAGAGAAGVRAATPGDASPSTARAAYLALGIACFVVVAVAVALGITIIVAAGFGKMVSFAHVWPTLLDKA
jgi:hypothetical protein